MQHDYMNDHLKWGQVIKLTLKSLEKPFGNIVILLGVDDLWKEIDQLLSAFGQIGSLGYQVVDHFGLVDLDWFVDGRNLFRWLVAEPSDWEADRLFLFT